MWYLRASCTFTPSTETRSVRAMPTMADMPPRPRLLSWPVGHLKTTCAPHRQLPVTTPARSNVAASGCTDEQKAANTDSRLHFCACAQDPAGLPTQPQLRHVLHLKDPAASVSAVFAGGDPETRSRKLPPGCAQVPQRPPKTTRPAGPGTPRVRLPPGWRGVETGKGGFD
mmetsp:Transcript_36510/g.107847  ORF Transcript_36510/g.107847 Transcript_36510/m.107847 type:complete len:170 (+) Transcript_36510:1527-2036(+)